MPTLIEKALAASIHELNALLTEQPELRGRLRGVQGVLHVVDRYWDRYADDQLTEIGTVSRLLDAGRACVSVERAKQLGDVLESVQATVGTSMRLGHLDSVLDRQNKALIELQCWLEEGDGPEAQALLQEIWAHLDASASARFVPGGLW